MSSNYKDRQGQIPFDARPSSDSPPPQYSYESGTRQEGRTSSSSRTGGGHANSVSSYSDRSYHRSPNTSTEAGVDKDTLRALVENKTESYRRHGGSRMGSMRSIEQVKQPRASGGASYDARASKKDVLPVRPRTHPRHEMRGLEQAASVRRWTGGGNPPHAWGKLRKDPELWDPTGDTLVYFSHSRPEASFRVQSATLLATDSPYFHSLLGRSRADDDREEYKSSTGPNTPPPSTPSASLPRDSFSQTSTNRSSTSDRVLGLRRPKTAKGISGLVRKGTLPTPPPLSKTTSLEQEAPVLHEIYFPAAPDASKMDVLRHHLTTRNVLALLQNKSIVGLNYYQALIDLLERLQVYMPPETDCASLMIDYLMTNRLEDIRNDPAAAAGLLAWSEELEVRWLEGWRESFVHCVGMYPQLCDLPEFRDVSVVSRALLERAHLELQVRISAAEDRLASFSFDDVWPAQSAQPPPARTAFDRFRRFLKGYYEHAYKTWPVRGTQENGSGWLTRSLATRMQKDFGALYDYFVDRDVVWDQSDEGNDSRWKIVSKAKRATFRADSADLPMTDIFTGFDARNKFPHIPHPYPLLPASIPIQYNQKSSFGFLGSKKPRGLAKRTALSYSEASNVFLLSANFEQNELVEAFNKHEKNDQLGEIDPYDARKGRWILLYCTLQVLASVSVDTPNLWFTDDVPYFLNPRLEGTPPWRTSAADAAFEEATRLRSHCWTIPSTWTKEYSSGWSTAPQAPGPTHKQIVIRKDGIGDGLGRNAQSDAEEEVDEDALGPSTSDRDLRHEEVRPSFEADDYDGEDADVRDEEAPVIHTAKEWPIQGATQGPRKPRIVGVVGRSDYVPPEDW